MYLDTSHRITYKILIRIFKRKILNQSYISSIREILIVNEIYSYYLKEYQYYSLIYNRRINKRLLSDRVITKRNYRN